MVKNTTKRNNPYLLLPSLLSANLAFLYQEVEAVMAAGADMLHIDIMDNHYVPNLTFGPSLCAVLQQYFPNAVQDVHLMVNPVDTLIKQFAQNGANRITIHPDATIHLERSLQLIREMNCKAGLALNPATSLECLTWCQHCLDFVIIMTVNPGFGGQKMISSVLPKIKKIHQLYPDLTIVVDGGINLHNIASLADLGASQFVVGSGFFSEADNYQERMKAFRHALNYD